MYKKLLWAFGALFVLCCGCQREIDLELPDYQPKLVIEGTIENGAPAMVMLSKSIPYFSEITLEMLMNDVLVTGNQARVFVTSETGETEELTWKISPEAPYYVAFMGSQVLGREQTHYTLTVEYDGKTYTAVTYIPKTFDLDSIGFDQSAEMLNDSMASIRMLLSDDPAEENYYAFFCKVNCPTLHDRLWISGLPVAFDDRTFNGLTFNYELTRAGYSMLLRGMMGDEEGESFSRLTFRPGDTVYVKHTQIDHDTYLYMLSAGSEAAFGSNPFTNPLPAVTNFDSEEVLGHWSGFAAKIDTIIWHTEPSASKFTR
ncbi:MAG: DUF4249 domain-containing protein [Bacteroidales bacterium]|nr:DUF4249 domain-containing protein [Bacteroidales bacterium]